VHHYETYAYQHMPKFVTNVPHLMAHVYTKDASNHMIKCVIQDYYTDMEKWRSWWSTIAEYTADCGKLEEEYKISSAEK
jgi:hypothetical protein